MDEGEGRGREQVRPAVIPYRSSSLRAAPRKSSSSQKAGRTAKTKSPVRRAPPRRIPRGPRGALPARVRGPRNTKR
jgi:hypothetical protein